MPANENDPPPAEKRLPEGNPPGKLPPPPWPGEPSLYRAGARRLPWGWALLAGFLCAGAAAAVAWFAIPVTYTATVWLRIAAREVNDGPQGGPGGNYLAHRSTQAALVTSNFVLSDALEQPEIAQLPSIQRRPDPVAWLKKCLNVSFPGNGEIMQIAMTGEDPDQLTRLANAVKDAYLQQVTATEDEDQGRRREVLEENYRRSRDELAKKSNDLNRLATQLGLADSEGARIKELHSLDTLPELRSRVNRLQDDISRADRRITILKLRLGKTGEGGGLKEKEEMLVARRVEARLAEDPWIAQAMTQMQALEAAVQEEKLRSGRENAPSVERLQDRLQAVEEGIAGRKQELLPQVTGEVRQEITQEGGLSSTTLKEQLNTLVDDAELEKSLLQDDLQTATQEFEDAATKAENTETSSTEMEIGQNELERLKRITQQMGDDLQKWEMDLAASPRVTLLEPASVPKSSNFELKLRNVSLSTIIAFLAGGAVVLAIGSLLRRGG